MSFAICSRSVALCWRVAVAWFQIDVVMFPEGAGGDQIVEKILYGPIHQQIRTALRYIQNNVIVEKVFKHSDRPEATRFFNYPMTAIEEALVNAMYHRGYDQREPVEVRVNPASIQKRLKRCQEPLFCSLGLPRGRVVISRASERVAVSAQDRSPNGLPRLTLRRTHFTRRQHCAGPPKTPVILQLSMMRVSALRPPRRSSVRMGHSSATSHTGKKDC